MPESVISVTEFIIIDFPASVVTSFFFFFVNLFSPFFTFSSSFSSLRQGGRCLRGTFCPPGSSHSQKCTPGFYCHQDELNKVSGPCAKGYYCSSGSMEERPINQTYGDICPPGSFCEEGSKAPNACREGYFARGQGNDNPSACQLCK